MRSIYGQIAMIKLHLISRLDRSRGSRFLSRVRSIELPVHAALGSRGRDRNDGTVLRHLRAAGITMSSLDHHLLGCVRKSALALQKRTRHRALNNFKPAVQTSEQINEHNVLKISRDWEGMSVI